MPTESPTDPPPSPRRRRRFKRLAVFALIVLLAAAGGVFYASRNLPVFARWALERAFPGAHVELKRLDWKWPNELEIEHLVLKSREDGAVLLSLEGGGVLFDFSDIRHRRIGEVRLVRPVLRLSPRFLEALAPAPSSEPGATSGSPWSVRKLTCEGGELYVTGFGREGVSVTGGFALDWENFDPEGDPDDIHRILFSNCSATTKEGETVLTLKALELAFSLPRLMKEHRLAQIRLDQLALSVSPALLAAWSEPAPGAGSSGESTFPDWRIDELHCDDGWMISTDVGRPGLTASTKFAFRWENLSLLEPAINHEMVFWNMAAALEGDEFFRLDLVRLGFRLGEIISSRTLGSLEVQGGNLIIGKTLRRLFPETDNSAPAPPSPPADPMIIKQLGLRSLTVRLQDERPEISDITFALNTELQNIPLSQAASDVSSQGQFFEIADLVVASPLDPLTKVITLESVAVRFTLASLVQRRIQELRITRPTIYLGEDLFWYMEDMERRLGGGPGGSGGTGWVIETLVVQNGQLSIASGGRERYGLPLNFRTVARDVALDNLASLKLRARLEIPPEKYQFESYQLEFTSEQGELQFDYPPEKQANNLVGTIKLSDIRWRQYQAKDAWLTVTFDRQGINGQFGGTAYHGDAGGGFSFFFEPTSPWIGWCFGKGIDLRRFTKVLSPGNFEMTGPLNFKLQMDAMGRQIDRIVGDLQTPGPGKMVIRKLDDLIDRIPPGWNLLKQSSTRIGLETLRNFDYTQGNGDFWFVQSQGLLRLRLQGPQGARNFDVALHADDTPEGRWKVRPGRKLEPKQSKKP